MVAKAAPMITATAELEHIAPGDEEPCAIPPSSRAVAPTGSIGARDCEAELINLSGTDSPPDRHRKLLRDEGRRRQNRPRAGAKGDR